MPRTFGSLLAHGTLYTTAIQLTSAMTVMPYISSELGGPSVAVAMLVPIFFAGSVLGTIYAASFLRLLASTTALLASVAVLQAVFILTNAGTVVFLPVPFSGYLIILIAGIVGLITGISALGYPVTLSALLPEQRRGDLMLRQVGLAALLMTSVSAYSVFFLSDGEGLDDATMLWLGTGVMALAAASCLALRPRAELPVPSSAGARTMLADGFAYVRQQPWLRRYLLVQLIFTAITLGPMFYGIYTSTTLGHFNGCLDRMLIFVGIGLFAGIGLWTAIRKRFGVYGLYLGSALLSLAAATFCFLALNFDLLPPASLRPANNPHMWTFGLTLMLAAMANQAVLPAAFDWLHQKTTADARVAVVTFSQVFVGVPVVFVSFLLGLIARQAPSMWPLAIAMVGAVAALLFATRVPNLARA